MIEMAKYLDKQKEISKKVYELIHQEVRESRNEYPALLWNHYHKCAFEITENLKPYSKELKKKCNEYLKNNVVTNGETIFTKQDDGWQVCDYCPHQCYLVFDENNNLMFGYGIDNCK